MDVTQLSRFAPVAVVARGDHEDWPEYLLRPDRVSKT
jgi:hypothetical protein